MLNHKIIALTKRQPSSLGLKKGRISQYSANQITKAFIEKEFPINYSQQLANTLLRLKDGSINLLTKWKIISEQEADILKINDLTSTLKIINETDNYNFTNNIKKLLVEYSTSPIIKMDELSSHRKACLLSRLIPVSEIEKIANLGVPINTFFEIIDSRFELIEQIEEAVLFVNKHNVEMNGDAFAWRFLIMYGLKHGEARFEEAKLFVEQNSARFIKGNRNSDTGRTAAWRYVSDFGLEKAKAYL
jgi:hypothetical protein